MQIRDLIPWTRQNGLFTPGKTEDNPVLALQREMNRIFDRFFDRFEQSSPSVWTGGGIAMPSVDIADTEDSVEVTVELPGIEEKDIDVQVSGDVLTVSGEKKTEAEQKHKGHHITERHFGRFLRTIPLPPGLETEKAEATLANGVLTVVVPKSAEAQAKIKKVEVKTK